MKLLHIFPSFAIGGQQRRMALLANALPGYTHEIVALDGDYDAASLFAEGVNWQKCDITLARTAFLHLGNRRELRRLLTERRPDLLCTYNWGSIEAAFANCLPLLGRPFVPQVHFEDGFGPDETATSQKKQRVLARRLLLSHAHVVVPSAVLREVALRQWQIACSRLNFIPNGVDVARFTPSVREEGSLLIGSVGALRAEKNIGRLLRCFAQSDLLDAELMIVGEGPERARLEAEAQSGSPPQVYFAGQEADPAPRYADFDIFALSSDTEQMPFGVLEAMASGLPVVSTDVGDVKKMVAPENHPYIIPLTDERGYAKALKTLAKEPALRHKIGRANREKVEREYSLDKMINTYDQFFQKIIRPDLSRETH